VRTIPTPSAAMNDRSTNDPIIGIQRVDFPPQTKLVMRIGAKPDVTGKVERPEVGFRHGDTAILSRLSRSIRAAEHVGVVGRSGAGKSTLLHLIAGMLRPESGKIVVNGSTMRGSGRGAVLVFRQGVTARGANSRERRAAAAFFRGAV
jgi:ABC-type multidrug transport system fused ATPase/permease subunit